MREAWDLAKASDDPQERLSPTKPWAISSTSIAPSAAWRPWRSSWTTWATDPSSAARRKGSEKPAPASGSSTTSTSSPSPPAPQPSGASAPSLIPTQSPTPRSTPSTPPPTERSLLEMSRLADEAGLTLQMAFRTGDATIPLPAMMHFKVGHFSALLKQEGDRFLIDDPCLGGEVWMTREALLEESSGYFLVPRGPLPQGWSPVDQATADTVRGKCAPANPSGESTGPCHNQQGGSGGGGGGGGCSSGSCPPPMATYSFHSLLGSLHIQDTPVGYAPPRGPEVQAFVTYNQRESYKPLTYTFSNLGSRWNLDTSPSSRWCSSRPGRWWPRSPCSSPGGS